MFRILVFLFTIHVTKFAFITVKLYTKSLRTKIHKKRAKFLIELHNENMMRFPMIVVVDKNLEKKFTQIIQDGIEQKKILYPSVYVDYITLEKGKNISEEISHGRFEIKK